MLEASATHPPHCWRQPVRQPDRRVGEVAHDLDVVRDIADHVVEDVEDALSEQLDQDLHGQVMIAASLFVGAGLAMLASSTIVAVHLIWLGVFGIGARLDSTLL